MNPLKFDNSITCNNYSSILDSYNNKTMCMLICSTINMTNIVHVFGVDIVFFLKKAIADTILYSIQVYELIHLIKITLSIVS